MRFGILGPVEAWQGGEPLALGGPKQLSLLAFLVLRANSAVSSDELIDGLWGAHRDGAGKRLSVAIARLRRALEPLDLGGLPVLQTVGGGYMLSLSAGELDAERFEALVRDGRDALAAGDSAGAGVTLREALGLWRGPALAPISFEGFALAEARRLEELRLLALEARIDADLALGADRGLVGELDRLLALHPTREHIAGQLMLALYRSGRQADALEVYRRTRAHLTTELGLEPGPALRTLEEQILHQARTIGVKRGGGPGWVPEHSLPSGPVTMVIAEIETAEAHAHERGHPDQEVIAGPDELRAVWARHRAAWVAERGARMVGLFTSPQAALDAAQEAVGAIGAPGAPADEPWPRGHVIRLRIGVHTGLVRVSAAGYWGEDIHYAACIAEVAHPGQILISGATAALLPDAALVDLGEHRLDGSAVPRRLFGWGAGPHPVPRSADPLRSNLPRAHGELIGRDLELAELTSALQAADSRLVTITGAGGAGKTRLALAVAEELVDVLADGAFFVALAHVSEPDAIAAVISASLGVHVQAGGELLARAPRLRVMVTSQAPLRVRGERVLALGPLQVPQNDDQRSVATAAAGRLLLERARETDPSFALTRANAESLAGLCRALGGSPLAIELAAARLTLLAPDELLARLDHGIDAIGHGLRDLPERQRGLRAALDWTHALLSEEPATLLRRLGVFAGPVPLERIEQVCGTGIDLLDALSQLVDLALVTPYRRRTVSPTRHRPRLRAREAHRGRRGPGDRAWPRRGLRRVGHGLGRPLPV